MTRTLKHGLAFSFIIFLFLVNCYQARSQGFIDRIKKKAENALNKKVDKTVDDALNGKKIIDFNNSGSDKRPKLSEIKESDFIQNDKNPEFDDKNTRYRIARNLLIDISGKYPNGYAPKWRFVNYSSPLNFNRENWIYPNSNLGQEAREISLVDYGGKLSLRLNAGCQCFADIVIRDSFNVLTENPQVFEIKNFRKILNERSTGEPCVGSVNWTTNGGWAGKISLSANPNGDINMDLMLENYTVEGNHGGKFKPSQVSYRYTAKNITIENEMSAEKATAIIVAEKEAKQRQKDYLAKTTKQSDSLQKVIAKKYAQKDCRNCFSKNSNSSLKVTPTTTVYTNGYGDVVGSSSGSDWDINTKTEITNKCGYDLTFIGLQQMYSEARGYYLTEVTKTMEKGYEYKSDQGAMASIFSSLIGGGSEFNFIVQDKYYPNYATVGAVQWLKVIKK